MFKNLVKKIKGAAKKIAPYAGVIAGAFGAGPWMSAGIGALGGGLGTGNAKGAVLGGLGGFGAGTMWGGQAGSPGGNRLFGNPLNIFNKDKAFFNPDQVANIGDLVMGNRFPVNPDPNLIGPPEMSTGLGRFKDFLTMEKNPLTGNALKEGSMYRFLPAAAAGTALAYGLGAFDEEPVPEDEIPKEYVYDAATDPLKNVNKRFQDYYQGITQIPSSSIYGYLQSIGALKEGGVPRGYSAGGSITPEMDIPGQFLLNSSAKTPLSVLEAADGMNTSVEDEIIEKYQNGEISEEQYLQMREGTNDGRLREAIVAHHSGKISDEEFIQITGVNPPQGDMNIFGLDFNQTLDKIIRKKDPKFGEGISGLESYVDTGEGEGIDQGLGAAKDVLQMGAEEAIKELGTTGRSIGPAGASTVSDDGKRMLDLTKGQQEAVKDGATQVEMTDNQEVFYSSPSDEGKTFGNGEFYYDDPNLIRFIQRKADQNGTTYQEELFKFVEEVESFYRNKKANGGLASFNYGGQIMGPGSGREDVIPGKIVDKNTGQTSDMLVSNNEHIIPEYALYAMGGGDTKKGHDMMDSLRKKTKPMAQKMGYDFSGAEDGSVMYG